jgi:hypothetical protein
MNKQLKDKWVAALRSETYLQGVGVLYRRTPTEDRYCCLGVLHTVEYGHIGWTSFLKEAKSYPSALFNESECYLSCEGNPFSYGAPQHFDKNTLIQLTELNDRLKCCFAGIATWIEKNIPDD